MGEDTEYLSKEIEFFFTNYEFSPLFNFAIQCRSSQTFQTYEFCQMKETKFEILRVYIHHQVEKHSYQKTRVVTNTQFF